MRCKRWGCTQEFSEKPDRVSGYRGGRYREFCSDACRKAEKRRQDEYQNLHLSLSEAVRFNDLVEKFFLEVRKAGREPTKFDHTEAHKYAKEKIETARLFYNAVFG